MRLRMYTPAIVLFFWAVVVMIAGLGRVAATVALLSVAAAVKIQVDEARRQHAARRGRSR